MVDWLGTRPGQMVAFFLLYVTEGLPLGYTATFIATLMREEGVSPATIGSFIALFYVPWSFKWAAGPFVDLFRSRRFGARRPWICGSQLLMTLSFSTLLILQLTGTLSITDVTLFSVIVFIGNMFGAVQDVAIDALAVDTLHESERGLANGLMFAGASIGSATGGSVALFLYGSLGFAGSTAFMLLMLLAVFFLVSLWLRERGGRSVDPSQRGIADRLWEYLVTAKDAFFGSRMGSLGLVLALLPPGGYALGLALQSNLAVELGMSHDEIGWLTIASTAAFALACVAGGLLSDVFGRLRSLAIYIVLTTLPTLAFAAMLYDAGWIMPVDTTAPNRPEPATWLLHGFWAMTVVFNIFNGLMYGTRSAFFMDFCEPKVAATQFTAYMALANLVISYTAFWQGYSIEAFGYPATLVLDAAAGLICLSVFAVVPVARRMDQLKNEE